MECVLICHASLPDTPVNSNASVRRTALQKRPRKRPIASRMLEHPWIVKHMAAVVFGESLRPRPVIERLLEPIPIYKILPPVSPTTFVTSPIPPASATRVQFNDGKVADVTPPHDDAGAIPANPDPLRALRAEFGGNTDAPSMATGAVPAGNKASLSFSLPAVNYSCVAVQQLSVEEKGETGTAVGMKARLQLYMSRQRM
jgi:hypothetical protein